MKKSQVLPYRLIGSIGLLLVVSLGFLIIRMIVSDSSRYVFLGWNLTLASLAPLFAWWLSDRIRQYGWQHWQNIVLALLWLSFLPNSFYLITDLVHIRETYEVPVMYDVVMLTSFLVSGLVLGYMSIYLLHVRLLEKIKEKYAYGIVGAVLFVCSFAIYLGRYARWNSWDIIMNPAGLVFDVSDRFINPSAHEQTYLITLTIFVLLASLYAFIYEATRLLRRN